MTAQKGRDLLLKVDASGTFQSVAGLRASTLSFNAETVDATSQESAGAWRELLAGAGLKSAAIRGNGIFKDAASDETVRGLFFNATIVNWQIIIPDSRPGFWARVGGNPRLPPSSRYALLSEILPYSAIASARKSDVKANGCAWKLPPETIRTSSPSPNTSGLSVTAFISLSAMVFA